MSCPFGYPGCFDNRCLIHSPNVGINGGLGLGLGNGLSNTVFINDPLVQNRNVLINDPPLAQIGSYHSHHHPETFVRQEYIQPQVREVVREVYQPQPQVREVVREVIVQPQVQEVVREVYQPQPEVRQVTRQVEFQPESTVVEREVIVQPEIREIQREVIVPAPEVRQETVQEVYQPAPVVREVVVPQMNYEVGPPCPIIDQGYLAKFEHHGVFDHQGHDYNGLHDHIIGQYHLHHSNQEACLQECIMEVTRLQAGLNNVNNVNNRAQIHALIERVGREYEIMHQDNHQLAQANDVLIGQVSAAEGWAIRAYQQFQDQEKMIGDTARLRAECRQLELQIADDCLEVEQTEVIKKNVITTKGMLRRSSLSQERVVFQN